MPPAGKKVKPTRATKPKVDGGAARPRHMAPTGADCKFFPLTPWGQQSANIFDSYTRNLAPIMLDPAELPKTQLVLTPRDKREAADMARELGLTEQRDVDLFYALLASIAFDRLGADTGAVLYANQIFDMFEEDAAKQQLFLAMLRPRVPHDVFVHFAGDRAPPPPNCPDT